MLSASANRVLTDRIQILNEKFPEIKGVPKGDPSRPTEYAGTKTYDGSLATSLLGVKYHSQEATSLDMTESLKKFL
jgi:hypothetical protein